MHPWEIEVKAKMYLKTVCALDVWYSEELQSWYMYFNHQTNWKGKTRAVLWILFHFKRVSCSWSIILLREALNCEKKRFFVKPLHKMVIPPPSPFYEVPIYFFFRPFFDQKKKMILKVVWRVFMGVLRVLEGCFRVFEVCLEGVWKNKIEVWNQSDPPPPR